MKTNVCIEKEVIKEFPEKGVVVCILHCQAYPEFQWMSNKEWHKALPQVSIIGKFTVIGKARCHSLDTFDLETGRRLAKGRAKAKMFKMAAKVWDAGYKDLKKYMDTYLMYYTNCMNAFYREESHNVELATNSGGNNDMFK